VSDGEAEGVEEEEVVVVVVDARAMCGWGRPVLSSV